MKKIKMSLTVVLLLICGAAFACTSKQESATIYVGFQPGYANMHYADLTGDSDNVAIDSSGFAGRFYVGYDFDKNFGAEIGYVFLPKVKFNNIHVPGYLPYNISFDQNIFDFCAKATAPLRYNLNLYSKAGIAVVIRDDLEVSSGGRAAESDYHDTKTVPVVGTGIDYGFNDHVFADLAYMHYFNKGDLQATDFIGFGLIYRI